MYQDLITCRVMGTLLKCGFFNKNVTNYLNISRKVSKYQHRRVSVSFVQDLQSFGPVVVKMQRLCSTSGFVYRVKVDSMFS